MESSELIKRVRRIELKTRGLSDHLFAGEYHSIFKGRGMSFSGVREYQFGDDVRAIDWNVTARMNNAYIKEFEEERELTVMLIADTSRSDHFGTRRQTKIDLMTEISAVLSFSALKNNDKVGLILFSDKIEKYIPPKKGRMHVLRIIRELIDFQPQSQGTDLSQALKFFNNITHKRSIAFLMSDFLCNDYEQSLKISSKKHDLVGLHIYDIRETELPAIGLARFADAETGVEIWIDTNNPENQSVYASFFEQKRAKMREAFRNAKSDLVEISTGDNYIAALMDFFKRREKKK